MSATNTQATTKDQAPPAQVVTKQPENPEKSAGPQQTMLKATGSAAPPSNGGSSIMRAAEMLNGQQGPGAVARANTIRTLQRSVGNNRIATLADNTPENTPAKNPGDMVQQFTVSQPEDPAEKEAEAVSRQVTSGEDAPAISRLASSNVQTLPAEEKEELARAERKGVDNDADANTASAGHAISHKGAGNPVNSSLREKLEPRMGADLSTARVHQDHNANKAAEAINARAFTHGNDVFLGRGESETDTHLMAHELTHVVQQSPESTLARAKKPAGKPAVELPVAPEVLELKGAQDIPEPIRQFFTDHKGADVMVTTRFGDLAQGELKVKVDKDGQYKIKPQPLALSHKLFAFGGEAVAALRLSLIVESNKDGLRGYIAPAAAAQAPKELENILEKAPDLIGLAGFSVPKVALTNELKNGRLQLGMSDVSIELGAVLSGKVSVEVIDDKVKFSGNLNVAVKGLDKGTLELNRDEESGVITGKASVAMQRANIKGALDIAWDGQAITGQGKVGYTGEKLSGELTVNLMEKGAATQLEQEKKAPSEEGETKSATTSKSTKKPKSIEYVVFGEGDLNFAFNEWLNGTAHVIVDQNGFVTIIGKITPQKEYELFEQTDFVKPLFKFEARASYGIPVVGNIFIFGNVSMDVFAKLGPAKFYNIVVEGTYSTDPEKNKDFSIKGSLNISAAAGARLRAEAGAGLEILGHDIKAGAGINGIAGIKAYAEATPVIGYREKGAPGEDKKGEFFIRGDMEIAGQPFLGLSGDLFLELDTPWWSPLSDDKWTWPLFDKEYPLGGSIGLKASVDYVFGSEQLPSIEFEPVDFDSSKFMTDLYHDKVKPKTAEAGEQASEWKEKNDASADPPTGAGGQGNATPGEAGDLPEAKPTVEADGQKSGDKQTDPNEKTAEGKAVKEYQEEAEKQGKKPDGPAVKGGPETSSEKKEETQEPESTAPAELTLSMMGTTHKLILTPSTPPKLEMQSKRDLLSNKIGRAVGKLKKVDPVNEGQVQHLISIGGLAKEVQREAMSAGKDPHKRLNEVTGFAELKDAIEAYSTTWKTHDIEELVAESTTPTLKEKVKLLLEKATHVRPADYGRARHWKGNSEEQRRASSEERRPGQFLYSLTAEDVEALEKDAFLTGDIEDKGADGYWAFKTFTKQIGYAGGEDAFLLRAEMTNVGSGRPSIHSHPRLTKSGSV